MNRTSCLIPCLLLMSCDRLPLAPKTEENATRACEERLKGELTSPSSYRRIWFSFTPGAPTTKQEEIDRDEADRLRARRSGDDTGAIIATYQRNCLQHPSKDCGALVFEPQKSAYVVIQYEAANNFNAMLPGYYTCRMTMPGDAKYNVNNVFTASALSRSKGERLKALVANR